MIVIDPADSGCSGSNVVADFFRRPNRKSVLKLSIMCQMGFVRANGHSDMGARQRQEILRSAGSISARPIPPNQDGFRVKTDSFAVNLVTVA
jgi:hypothetical protein